MVVTGVCQNVPATYDEVIFKFRLDPVEDAGKWRIRGDQPPNVGTITALKPAFLKSCSPAFGWSDRHLACPPFPNVGFQPREKVPELAQGSERLNCRPIASGQLLHLPARVHIGQDDLRTPANQMYPRLCRLFRGETFENCLSCGDPDVNSLGGCVLK